MKSLKSHGIFPFTVFLGAFLLFQIQPIIGKYFLPWFGGAPAVWLTCLMFFQILLFGGYAYAHFLQRLRPSRQVVLHIGLLAVALIIGGVLAFVWGSPILPSRTWRPDGIDHPTSHILWLLSASIGLSYFLLSTSASLLQAWFHRVNKIKSPYVFYIVSNTASLLALLSYPFVVEPHLTIQKQAWVWSGGFLIYSVLCGVCASKVRNLPDMEQEAQVQPALARADRNPLLWTLLSSCGVLALMAITNQMTQDIPPVPFLWILPLTLYLLSYIIGFVEKLRGWQDIYVYILLCAFGVAWYLMKGGLELEIWHQITAYCFILFAICLFCHNALYCTRPDPKHLTGFYLCISMGGALGGLFTVLAAPFLFKGYWEYQLALLLSGSLVVFFIYTNSETRKTFRSVRHVFPVALTVFMVFLGSGIWKEIRRSVYMERNFFGSLRVVLETNNGIPIYSLLHGKINHGMQIQHPKFINRTTTYYTENGGGGLAILNHSKRLAGQPMRVGLLGMGIGVLSAYAHEGDVFRFYEIDPAVIELAKDSPWFSFLRNAKAKIEIVSGDGRISLEREAGNRFDVLVLDAFSGDQIPVQTLTLEAFELYLRHMEVDGVIAVHVSNRNLDLLPVLIQVRNHFNLYAAYINTPGDMKISANAQWVLLSRDIEFMRQAAIARADSLKVIPVRPIRSWTDDYSNLLDVMKGKTTHP